MAAPVIVFAYNRKDMLEKTLMYLEKNDLASETDVFIFADGSKGEIDRDAVRAVHSYLTAWKNQNDFRSVHLELRTENQGLAKSVIGGVTKVLAQYDRIIVVEDDLVTSSDFLVYMNQALDYFATDSRVWSVSGYVPELDVLKKYPHDVFLYPRACSWGWATWRDRWENIDWTVSDYTELASNRDMIKRFNRGGEDMFAMLKRQMQGKIDSWAIRWCYAQNKAGMYCVYPVASKVQNIGCGNGTHFHGETGDRYRTATHVRQCDFSNCKVDPNVEKEFRAIYTVTFQEKIKRKVKSMVKKLGFVSA